MRTKPHKYLNTTSKNGFGIALGNWLKQTSTACRQKSPAYSSAATWSMSHCTVPYGVKPEINTPPVNVLTQKQLPFQLFLYGMDPYAPASSFHSKMSLF